MNIMEINEAAKQKLCFTLYQNIFTKDESRSIAELQIKKDIVLDTSADIVPNSSLNTDLIYRYEECIIDDNPKLEEQLIAYIFDCNAKIYGYDIWGFEKDPSILTLKPGCYIGMHDKVSWYTSEPNDRKLSAMLFLNSHQDYKGGEVKADTMITTNPSPGYNRQGNLLIFPSFVGTAIQPILEGVMQVLTFNIIGSKLR